MGGRTGLLHTSGLVQGQSTMQTLECKYIWKIWSRPVPPLAWWTQPKIQTRLDFRRQFCSEINCFFALSCLSSPDWAWSLGLGFFPIRMHRANTMLAAPQPKHQGSLRSDHPPIRADTQAPGIGHLTAIDFAYMGRVRLVGWHM